jgi:hypothetical protein
MAMVNTGQLSYTQLASPQLVEKEEQQAGQQAEQQAATFTIAPVRKTWKFHHKPSKLKATKFVIRASVYCRYSSDGSSATPNADPPWQQCASACSTPFNVLSTRWPESKESERGAVAAKKNTHRAGIRTMLGAHSDHEIQFERVARQKISNVFVNSGVDEPAEAELIAVGREGKIEKQSMVKDVGKGDAVGTVAVLTRSMLSAASMVSHSSKRIHALPTLVERTAGYLQKGCPQKGVASAECTALTGARLKPGSSELVAECGAARLIMAGCSEVDRLPFVFGSDSRQIHPEVNQEEQQQAMWVREARVAHDYFHSNIDDLEANGWSAILSRSDVDRFVKRDGIFVCAAGKGIVDCPVHVLHAALIDLPKISFMRCDCEEIYQTKKLELDVSTLPPIGEWAVRKLSVDYTYFRPQMSLVLSDRDLCVVRMETVNK